MGGGPSREQSAAAASQARLTDQESQAAQRAQAFVEKQQGMVNPFYQQRMQGGLPYMNALTDAQSGITARAFQPARADLLRRLGPQSGLPSGFREQSLTDLSGQQAHAYDQNLIGGLQANEQAKQAGASGLLGQAQIANPQGYFSGAMGGNQSIMQAPLQRPGIGGLLAGLAGSAASAYAGR